MQEISKKLGNNLKKARQEKIVARRVSTAFRG